MGEDAGVCARPKELTDITASGTAMREAMRKICVIPCNSDLELLTV
jgi:hypothetical protein